TRVADPAFSASQDERAASAGQLCELVHLAQLQDRDLERHGQAETAPGCVEPSDEGAEPVLSNFNPVVSPIQAEMCVGGAVQSWRKRMLDRRAEHGAAPHACV